MGFQLFLFSLAWAAIIYLFNSFLAKEIKKIEWKELAIYVSALILLGLFGEVFVDFIYTHFFGKPLWLYRLLPVHSGYTSYFSLVIWALYGFHLYLLHGFLNKKGITKSRFQAGIISIEAVVLEVLINVSYLFIFKGFIFYYLPNDMWHVTSIQAIPIYFLAGLVLTKSLKRFKKDPIFFAVMCLLLSATFIFFT